ncbi:hypothetical protein [Tropicimonas sp. IMCC6043]|uniref:hypothetical protein n=1 Tax=Tropicimonas sp. IMCC6043 TaxID=2510645 RepID=UPI00101CDB19|nr:hypothetical protein [Tropicimonas sp. IMCC6043]RYH07494.1 hypothetical protein EU800_20115 [Tropicimonas sp. IMCC6043]
MTHRAKDLARLKKVTEAGWLAASQALRRKADEEREVAARLADLGRDRAQCLELISGDPTADVAQIATTAKWLRWSDAERARLNLRLARIRAEMAREQQVARKAFARDHALGKLVQQLGRPGRP